MYAGIYNAASAMDMAERQHEVTAHNLAAAHIPGYCRRIDVGQVGEQEPAAQAKIDFTPGSLQRTGRPLDVALVGEGFFTVQGSDGSSLYTRAGDWFLNSEGEVTTVDGLPVLASGRPLRLPQNASESSLTISETGEVRVGDQSLGTLDIVTFDDPSGLQPMGHTLFQASPELAPAPSSARVQQGVRELSNVSIPLELVRMLAGVRNYEAAQRAMQSLTKSISQRMEN
jgi:flagellar basal-body rod protein FlgF